MSKELPLRTIVADDHRLFRKGLISLTNTRPDLVRIVGEAKSGDEAVALCRRLHPDLILLDILMQPRGGLEAAASIRADCPNVAVVMLTASELDEYVEEAMRLGVAGYLLKDLDAAELFDLVEGVSRGEVAVTRTMALRMLKNVLSPVHRRRDDLEQLTSREIEVLRLVARGMSNPQIARELFVTVNTIKAHLKRIFEKLHFENRTQLAAFAVRRGLCAPEEQE